jgi:hypothetical protein
LAGGRYRVHNETAGRRAYDRDDAWDLFLRGRGGFVAPWAYAPPRGSGALVACTNSTVTTTRLLATIPGCMIVQNGDDGANIAFPAEYFDAVAGILRLRKRRQYTPEQRRVMAARLRSKRVPAAVVTASGGRGVGEDVTSCNPNDLPQNHP